MVVILTENVGIDGGAVGGTAADNGAGKRKDRISMVVPSKIGKLGKAGHGWPSSFWLPERGIVGLGNTGGGRGIGRSGKRDV